MANNNIKAIVNAITKEYNTRNPFDLADHLGIYVHKESDLGTILGYYLITPKKEKLIVLNNSMDETFLEIFNASRLLGHAILHNNGRCYLYNGYIYLPENKEEIEAHKFASELLEIKGNVANIIG